MQRGLEERLHLLGSSAFQQQVSQGVQRIGIVRPRSNCRTIGFFGGVRPSLCGQQVTKIVPRLGVVRTDFDGPSVGGFGDLLIAKAKGEYAPVIVQTRVVGRDGEAAVGCGQGFRKASALVEIDRLRDQTGDRVDGCVVSIATLTFVSNELAKRSSQTVYNVAPVAGIILTEYSGYSGIPWRIVAPFKPTPIGPVPADHDPASDAKRTGEVCYGGIDGDHEIELTDDR
jgi:hypothetical protein